MAVRMLWRYVTGRVRTLFRNYNVVERAEKVMESEKRVPPRHPGTEVKFQVLIKESKIRKEIDKKPDDLLGRLKTVKVSAEGPIEKDSKSSRPLPQAKEKSEMPLFGFEEPKYIPEGRCSLKQALEFITNHQNDPNKHSIDSISKTYDMNASDVNNIMKHFQAFEVYVSSDGKIGDVKSIIKSLGAIKIVQPLYKPKFIEMEQKASDSKD